MATRNSNRHRGSSAQDWFEEEEARSPGFIAAIDAEAGKHLLAAKLRELRELAGLSQAELAAKVGTQQPGIARVERAAGVPSLEMLYKIGSALGFAVEVRFTPRRRRRRS